MNAKLTPATLKTLRALWDAPNMTLRYSEAQSASGVTHKGFNLVLARALNENLVDHANVDYRDLALTLKGMLALRGHYAALYNERPCEAHRLEADKFSRLPDRTEATT